MVLLEDGAVRFRHELARQAVEDALSPTRRQALHAQVLHLLLEHEGYSHVSLARLVHHAAEANEVELVLRLAPTAARQAATQGAHREAAAHYRRALAYAGGLPAEQRAALLDALAHECYLHGQLDEALQSRVAALSLWRGLKETERVGHTLRQLSAFCFRWGGIGMRCARRRKQ